MPLPGDIPATVEMLDDNLSAPPPALVEMFRRLPGDILFLGVGGKMGPTMALMARRASELANTPRRIIGVSRFSNSTLPQQLQQWGIETIACDLLDEQAVERLPETPLVVSMSGFKFGAQANPSLTWAMNCYVPTIIAKRFQHSRIVSFSSGNIYARVPVTSAGSVETDDPQPVGEYAMTVLGRERLYDYFSRSLRTPMALLRLNYATELRYGVLVDLAQMVWNNKTIDLSMGYVNVIWQADANAMSLQMLEHATSPPTVMNIAGKDILRVRDVCEHLGRLLDRTPTFTGTESSDALLNNAARSHQLFGPPATSLEDMLRWTAAWVRNGGATLNKPTHFGSRSGKF